MIRTAEMAFGALSPQRIGSGIECLFSSAFDTNGVLYHIATDGGKVAYRNPHTAGLVVVSESSRAGVLIYDPQRFVEHTHDQPVFNSTQNLASSWMAVDLGEGRALRADHYCLRSGKHPTYNLRNWELQGSHDGKSWATLRRHADDVSIEERAMSVAAWPIEQAEDAYRHFRVIQTGLNSASRHSLMCTGIELYGKLQRA